MVTNTEQGHCQPLCHDCHSCAGPGLPPARPSAGTCRWVLGAAHRGLQSRKEGPHSRPNPATLGHRTDWSPEDLVEPFACLPGCYLGSFLNVGLGETEVTRAGGSERQRDRRLRDQEKVGGEGEEPAFHPVSLMSAPGWVATRWRSERAQGGESGGTEDPLSDTAPGIAGGVLAPLPDRPA